MKNNCNWLPYIHNKTGNIYFVIGNITNCTNMNDGQIMTLYVNSAGDMFVRESDEFDAKFTAASDLKIDAR